MTRVRPAIVALATVPLLIAGSIVACADDARSAPASDAAVHVAASRSAPAAAVPAPAAAAAARPRGPAPAPARSARLAPRPPLDLKAPPINHVLTQSQVKALTTEHDSGPVEDVMVESPQYVAPVPVGQLRAIPWALMHPLEAWRIFAPISDQ